MWNPKQISLSLLLHKDHVENLRLSDPPLKWDPERHLIIPSSTKRNKTKHCYPGTQQQAIKMTLHIYIYMYKAGQKHLDIILMIESSIIDCKHRREARKFSQMGGDS